MPFTTPPRPFDVTALCPQLAPLARTATRLHPRPGSPTVHDSSVGGPLLWPADEPWPHCDEPHVRLMPDSPVFSPEDERQWRRALATGEAGTRNGPGRPWPEGPIAMLPVAQLYARDLPLPGPCSADLLQVLWCPFDHGSQPKTALRWRFSAEISHVLQSPPEPSAIQHSFYLPEPCLLAPEQVVEYPHPLELSDQLQQQLADPGPWEAAGAVVDEHSDDDDEDESASYDFYRHTLSISPGWKVGGWTRWGLTDPQPRFCPVCATEAIPLLTIASTEWNAGSESWMPQEERSTPTPLLPRSNPAGFTQVTLAHGYDLQLHICPVSPDHPQIELIQ
ncbi:hypothetical protein [Streptomyces evansiae]|uniref:hypothetical protein n=1 Tax=Streptomyces evansiae TaxID=3075535 RepID=UPI00288695F6|nr:hypothetical protein [Streptomyces sp. DSM 41859]MDT0420486.1 hypothetical protein [Streptomyces sp. DSM 41859]